MTAEVTVVHLVWKGTGIDSLERFISSYQAHPAGMEHDLVIAFKAFEGDEARLARYRMVAGRVPHRELIVPNSDFDIGSYFFAAKNIDSRYLCFLNSTAHIKGPDWLRLLHDALTQPGVGAVAPCGSWEHFHGLVSFALEFIPVSWRGAGAGLKRRWKLAEARRARPPSPNYHLRTSMLMVERRLWLELWPGRTRTKWHAYRFEAGPKSLTWQLQARGLEVLVVGRNGRGYTKEEWPESGTFRSRDQSNLLLADKQTLLYDVADEQERARLRLWAWGHS
ncbi:MAG TPA: hypothetical protein VG015_04570 [Candidatus Dormibacteraeota bacterium]|jgi:hypothetical protein|nr:hypothetical protein [Candidatus Dormibacteraeota bacterium]